MAVQAKKHIKKCHQCIIFKAKQQKAVIKSIVATHPLKLVHINYLCLRPGKGKEENILVVTDHFTQYAQAYVTQSQTAQSTAKVLWDNFIVHYGLPEKIPSDQGRNFESELIANLCRLTSTKKLRTNPYHLQTNRQFERFNSTLFNILGTLPPECMSDWKGNIGSLVHAHNCTCNSTMGFSPYLLLYGWQLQLPIDVTLGITPQLITAPTSSKYDQKLRDHMKWAHRKTDLFLWKEAQSHKQNYDRHSRAVSLRIRDVVLSVSPPSRAGTKFKVDGRTGSMWWNGNPTQTYQYMWYIL